MIHGKETRELLRDPSNNKLQNALQRRKTSEITRQIIHISRIDAVIISKVRITKIQQEEVK